MNCHGESKAHVANERNEVSPDRIPRGAAADGLCQTCHASGCPSTGKTAGCTSCHNQHSLTNPEQIETFQGNRSSHPIQAEVAKLEEFHAALDRAEKLVTSLAEAVEACLERGAAGDAAKAVALARSAQAHGAASAVPPDLLTAVRLRDRPVATRIATLGARGYPPVSLAAAFSTAVRGFLVGVFGSRFSNSKPTFPSAPRTRSEPVCHRRPLDTPRRLSRRP